MAVKLAKKNAPELLDEGRVMMCSSGHPNVVAVLGVVLAGTPELPVMLLLTYCEHGSLLDYLRRQLNSSGGVPQMFQQKSCIDIAAGMLHLHKCGCVHRDLASRNVLVSSRLRCLIADFGMSRATKPGTTSMVGGDGDYYRVSGDHTFAVRWTAPEACTGGKFSMKTDVWSFGVTMWEVFSDGAVPYATVKTVDVLPLLVEGSRLDQPKGCPDHYYSIMHSCWNQSPETRPTFNELVRTLSTNSTQLNYGDSGSTWSGSLSTGSSRSSSVRGGISFGATTSNPFKTSQDSARSESGEDGIDIKHNYASHPRKSPGDSCADIHKIAHDSRGYVVGIADQQDHVGRDGDITEPGQSALVIPAPGDTQA